MNNLCLISIIIPVYNVEKYLCTCVDSILSQSFKNYELFLVDDGSSDGSPALCDEYAAKDNRIKVIHKENAGASEARNTGMLVANGKYLYFMDADDFLAEGSLDIIVTQMEADGECDIFLLNSIDVFTDGSYKEINYKYDKNMIYKKSRKEVLEYFLSISQFPIPPWIKLIRRQFLIEKNIHFTKGLFCCNDLDHMVGLILTAESFNYCDFPCYCYRSYREGSLSSGSLDKLFTSLLYVIKKWYDLSENNYREYASVIHVILVYQYCTLLSYYHSLDKANKAVYKNEMKKYATLMSTSKNRNVILANIIYRLFGLRIVSRLIYFYYIHILRKGK